jgi:hypothetical protein
MSALQSAHHAPSQIWNDHMKRTPSLTLPAGVVTFTHGAFAHDPTEHKDMEVKDHSEMPMSASDFMKSDGYEGH